MPVNQHGAKLCYLARKQQGSKWDTNQHQQWHHPVDQSAIKNK